MTERLSALLHQEADRLDVPMPPAQQTISAGRRLRRRRRLTQATAVVGAAAVVGGVSFGAATVGGSDEPRPPADGRIADTAPTGAPAVDLGAVFAVDDTVYLDGGAATVQLPEVAQAFYYTSAGLLVRTNETGDSDGGAPFHFELVGADGQAAHLDLTLGEVVPATDPEQPYVAYADVRAEAVDVVVHDVTTDQEVARIPVQGLGDWGGWEAPPVALDGDTVYVADFERTLAVDWRSGTVAPAALLGTGPPVVAGGRTVKLDDEALHVVDLSTGGDVLTILKDAMKAPWATLSPEGRHAIVVDQMAREPELEIYDLDAGRHVTLRGNGWEYGWTAGGELYGVDARGVHACDSTTGECTTTALPEGVDVDGVLVRIGGRTYES